MLNLPLSVKLAILGGVLLIIGGSVIAYLFLMPKSSPQQQITQQPSQEKTASPNSPATNPGKKEEAKKEDTTQKPGTNKPAPSPTPSQNGGTSTPAPNNPGTPPPAGGGSSFPNASNTGVPAGTSLSNYGGPSNNSSSGIVLENLNFPAVGGIGYYIFSGSNITIRNSYFASGVLFNGDNITVERSTINDGVSFSGTAGVLFRYNNVQNFAGDAMHVTADSGPVSNVTLASNYVHAPAPSCGDHADGLQVRGVNGLSVTGNTIDMGPWIQVCGADVLNAAIFLESANGGNTNMTISANYLNGGGYILRLTPGAGQTITNNAFGNNGQYGQVLNNTSAGNIINKSGNYFLSSGNPITF